MARGLFLLAALMPCAVGAQVTNGSFEAAGAFSDVGWTFTNLPPGEPGCRGGYEDVPPGGGAWALYLYMRNYQGGCVTAATQTLEGARDGDVVRVSVWALVGSEPPVVRARARLYLTDYVAGDDPGAPPNPWVYVPRSVGPEASTTSAGWAELVLVDTLALAPGDSVGVVLEAGWTSGSEFPADWASFDLVSAERLGNVGTEAPPASAAPSLRVEPNPAVGPTTVRLSMLAAGPARAAVYDALGREVALLHDGPLPAGPTSIPLDASRLTPGVYTVRAVGAAWSASARFAVPGPRAR